MKRTLCFVAAAFALLFAGCARQVPAARLAEEGGDVEFRLMTVDESLVGTVVSITSTDIVVDVVYSHGGGVSIEGRAGDRRVVVRGTPVQGEVLEVERTDDGRVTATVRRTFPVRDIAFAEFAKSRRETTLGTLISQVAGPAIGLLLGLLIQG